MNIDRIKIKVLMVQRGWNQKELSGKANIRESTLSNILNGKSNGTMGTWFKIAKALNVDLKDLFGTEKEQTR